MRNRLKFKTTCRSLSKFIHYDSIFINHMSTVATILLHLLVVCYNNNIILSWNAWVRNVRNLTQVSNI